MVMATVGGTLIAVVALLAIVSARRGAGIGSLPVRVEELFEAGPDAMVVVDRSGTILIANRLAGDLFGCQRAELIGCPVDQLMPGGGRATHGLLRRKPAVNARARPAGSGDLTLQAMRRDGTTFPADITLSPLSSGAVIAAVRDATAREAAVSEIVFLNRMYSTLTQTSQLIALCDDETRLFERICQVAVTAGELRLAWVGRVDAQSGKIVCVASSSASAEFAEYLCGLAVHTDAARPEGRGPFGIAWREGRPVFVQDFRRDERVALWRDGGRAAPWGSSAALPIRRAGAVHAVLSLYDIQTGAFSSKVIDLLRRIVTDIESALGRLDLLAEKKDTEERISQLLSIDPLTSLPNRRVMLERLDEVVARAARRTEHGAVLLLGLDRFRTLNEILGHQTGDKLLQDTAQRLRAAIPADAPVGRVGGDEFLVLLESLGPDARGATEAARRSAEQLLSAVLQPHLIGERVVSCSVSIGAAVWGDEPRAGSQELLRRAEVAMRAAKSNGRNAVRLFTPGMQLALDQRSRLETRLRHEFNVDQLQLYFQKRVDAHGATLGAEALLRWCDPQRGLVPPMELVPVAEEIGLIHEIGRWVLGRACRQLKEWSRTAPARRLRLAVNVSPRQLAADGFVDQTIDILARTGADPRLLELEVTEGLPIQDVEEVIPKMQALRALGIRFAIDDFGIGYSSLSYLRHLPISVLKIDRSFVSGMTHPDGETLVHTIVQMARSLDLQVIAEGVEAQWQRDMLMRHGCDQYQGYLFGRPVPIEAFDRDLAVV